ncbi:MAG: ribonuclease R, partial [Melioribacteraceae bacterium]
MKKQLIAFFKNHPSLKIKAKDLAKKLQITDEHSYAELKHFLHTLSEEGILKKEGKRFQFNTPDRGKLTGTLQIVGDGDYGFVILKNKDIKDVFVTGKNFDTAFDGDLVEISLIASRRGKKSLEGEIVKVLERKRTEIVGTLHKNQSFFFIKPDEQRIHRDIYVAANKLAGAKAGDKVAVGDIEWKSVQQNPVGSVKEILGKAGSFDAELSSIAREFGLTY